MKIILFLFAVSVLVINNKVASAQVMRDGNNKTILTKDADVEGSRYLNDKWALGSVSTANGKKLENVYLKYDVYENKLIFKTENSDDEQTFADLVKSFTFKGPPVRNFSNDFPAVAGQKSNVYYEVLSTGKKSLLKSYGKELSEIKTYGSSETVKKFEESESYYVFADGKMLPVKKNKASMLATLSDKSDKIDQFLKAVNLNFKNDDDLKKFFDFYNGL
ncbi:hypothetical protein [Mucilaginibacter ginkgonis]|uniref:Uncharacterized protein n=1 Tax=Mucilaginibacter ginkgonis TaxID=2682091 RepID=A0A6I4HV23_9SPHI|nr:hypothetical protein [Mucilaginibacter ginkgonis]QQL50011.1 hypothetical protein GO620_000745 [Mucilaginibacter ginkgonis]